MFYDHFSVRSLLAKLGRPEFKMIPENDIMCGLICKDMPEMDMMICEP